ncbi:MAG: hypothetical protein ACD_2C00136G0002 [uncultured bacterium (gcode 4)]|uniref:Uncharacterized protein n=1 Tax=uncultured bacterium (gcode 4) TaxID=1234023 RepID=K2FEK3_9BACT|nr:MAG: hypothetical protein ACD_2C00136G0002 [uncultured bacterium (gcode 4)]
MRVYYLKFHTSIALPILRHIVPDFDVYLEILIIKLKASLVEYCDIFLIHPWHIGKAIIKRIPTFSEMRREYEKQSDFFK